MSWWLVRIYLCTAILNFVFAMSQSHANQKNNPARKNYSVESPRSKDNKTKSSSEKNLDDTHTSGTEKRPLSAGDSFTPREILPIAEKLLKKVSDPGSGHGFVSSTFRPQELADKLFETFFMTSKRIVFLKDEDLPGIDALQALALSGEIADTTQGLDYMTKAGNLRSEVEKTNYKRCKYTLVSKNVTKDNKQGMNSTGKSNRRIVSKNVTKDNKQGTSNAGKPNRRRINLARYLNKKRHLIVNRRQRPNKSENKQAEIRVATHVTEKGTSVTSTDLPVQEIGNSSLNKNQNCRWKYGCSDIVNLDTCRIYSHCSNNTTYNIDEFPITNNSDAHDMAFLRLRKMMRVFYVDEEVEKILESRNMQMRPLKSNAAEVERVESLAEYFNKIIVQEQLGVTKSLASSKNKLMGNEKEIEEIS